MLDHPESITDNQPLRNRLGTTASLIIACRGEAPYSGCNNFSSKSGPHRSALMHYNTFGDIVNLNVKYPLASEATEYTLSKDSSKLTVNYEVNQKCVSFADCCGKG